MSRRTEPFPSSIEDCATLLPDMPSISLVGVPRTGLTYEDHPQEVRPRVILPHHPHRQFLPIGALLGEYGTYMLRDNVITVNALSNPDHTEDFSDIMYCVSWWWRRRFGAGSSEASWCFEPRGEGYLDRRIAATALYNTFHGYLDGQDEARLAWEKREADVKTYLKERDASNDHRDYFLTRHFEKFKAGGMQPSQPSELETDHLSIYTPTREAVPLEPTNEELGMPSLGAEFQQPPTRTS